MNAYYVDELNLLSPAAHNDEDGGRDRSDTRESPGYMTLSFFTLTSQLQPFQTPLIARAITHCLRALVSHQTPHPDPPCFFDGRVVCASSVNGSAENKTKCAKKKKKRKKDSSNST